jgi:hypothetical protein
LSIWLWTNIRGIIERVIVCVNVRRRLEEYEDRMNKSSVK